MELSNPFWILLSLTVTILANEEDYIDGNLVRFSRLTTTIDPGIVLLNTTAVSVFYCISLCISDPDCLTCLYHDGSCTTLSWYLHISESNPTQDKDAYFYYGWPVISNIALNKTAIQSSTYSNYTTADLAVDGKALDDQNSCLTQSHTADGDKTPWLQIDLINIYKILQVRFVGKTKVQVYRLHDINIIAGDTPNNLNSTCAYYVGPPSIAEWVKITCSPQTEGRFVQFDKMYATNKIHLELCEVEITVMA